MCIDVFSLQDWGRISFLGREPLIPKLCWIQALSIACGRRRGWGPPNLSCWWGDSETAEQRPLWNELPDSDRRKACSVTLSCCPQAKQAEPRGGEVGAIAKSTSLELTPQRTAVCVLVRAFPLTVEAYCWVMRKRPHAIELLTGVGTHPRPGLARPPR